MKREKKEKKERNNRSGEGEEEKGKEGKKKIPSTWSVRRGSFQSCRCVPVEHSLQEKETIPGKWQSYILILAKMWVITPSVKETMKCEAKKMSS